MGEYQQICPISTLPIFSGEEGVLIIWNQREDYSPPIYCPIENFNFMGDILNIVEGEVNHCGWIKDYPYTEYDAGCESTLINKQMWEFAKTIATKDITQEYENFLRLYNKEYWKNEDDLRFMLPCGAHLHSRNLDVRGLMCVAQLLAKLGRSFSGAGYPGQRFSDHEVHINVLEKSLEIAKRDEIK